MAGLPPGVQLLQRDWLSSNNVVVTGASHCAVIDTGFDAHAPQTLALVEHVLGDRPLDTIVNTHLHSDHCGGNAVLQQRYACETRVPASLLATVQQWDLDRLTFDSLGQTCERFTAHTGIQDGDEIRLGDLTWQAIASPGHDNDSFMLYNARHRLLISADALWEHGFGIIFPELLGESGFAEQRLSLDRIAALKVDLVIPGHGRLFTDVQQALTSAYSRLDYLAADPKRNARNSMKGLVKFLLLSQKRVSLEQLAQALDASPMYVELNRRFFGLTPAALAQHVVELLVAADVARLDNDVVIDHP